VTRMPVKPRQDPRQPNTVDVDVGRLVRVQRMARGLSQTELANRIGVTFQQVQKYETGSNRISMGRLVRIGRVLRVDVTYLLGGSSQAVPGRASDPKERARLADGLRMLGRIGALRLLKAFLALPTHPPQLRESILNIVEGTATAAQQKRVRRGATRRQSRKRNARRAHRLS
jgi:transcriptional regulator with XRE-family HTH domain